MNLYQTQTQSLRKEREMRHVFALEGSQSGGVDI